jgi:hypothetical protein
MFKGPALPLCVLTLDVKAGISEKSLSRSTS